MLLTEKKSERSRSAGIQPAQPVPPAVWKSIGGFGLALAVVGLMDMGLVWYPTDFGNPGWEFAAVDQSYAGLPLVTMGFAGLLASAIGGRSMWMLRMVAAVMLLMGMVLLAGLGLYFLNVPAAMNLAPQEIILGLQKAVVKTTVTALVFSGLYIVASISALRMRRKLSDASVQT